MMTPISMITRLAVLGLAALLASTGVLADKGGKHGHGNKHEQRDDDRRYDDRRNDISIQVYFGNNDRRIVNEYYAPEFRAGHCPPGLAKKGNGCMPPGQAKKWRKGQPLPQGIAYYELPHDLVYRMPPPPPRHRYVRVGSDILLLSIGSGIVVDAMIDIGR
jgi:Ni/Co efflux regulator RcnB